MKKLFTTIIFIGFICTSCENLIVETAKSDAALELSIDCKNPLTKATSTDLRNEDFNLEDYPYTATEDSVYIESLGWKIDDIVDCDSLYIINGELLAYKNELSLHRTCPQERLYGNTLPSSKQHIYLNINSTDCYDDLQALINAIDEWNNLPDCNIYFTSNHHTLNSSNQYGWLPVDIHINNEDSFFDDPDIYDCTNELGFMIMLPIGSEEPSRKMWVNTSQSEHSKLDSNQKKYAYMHALGHIITLKDADKKSDWIAGTYNTDLSIMTSYTYLKSHNMQWTGFTQYDKDDLSYVYPLNQIIVTDISLEEVKDDLLASKQLKLYKPYTFTAHASTIKRGSEQIPYIYSITGGNYEMECVNDSTVRVVFTELGNYDIRVSVNSNKLDPTFSGNHSTNQTYKIVGDTILYPTSIVRNIPFELYWRYTNRQYPEASIIFSGEEHLFDNDDRNITFSSISNGRTRVTLKDFGQFTITMKAVKPNGEILEQHNLYIEEYYRPSMDVVDASQFFQEVPFNCFAIGNDICTENMRLARPNGSINNKAITVRLDTENKFKHRCYIKAYKKYHRRLYDFARRVDIRHVTDTSLCHDMLFNKDDIALYFVPSQELIMPASVGGLGENESAEYTSYMTFIVPNDNIRFE